MIALIIAVTVCGNATPPRGIGILSPWILLSLFGYGASVCKHPGLQSSLAKVRKSCLGQEFHTSDLRPRTQTSYRGSRNKLAFWHLPDLIRAWIRMGHIARLSTMAKSSVRPRCSNESPFKLAVINGTKRRCAMAKLRRCTSTREIGSADSKR